MSTGRVVGNHYALGELLGSGGMGTVYRGMDTRTGDPVAIKLLKPDLVARDPQIVERFTREGEALRVLNHPNIVKVLATVVEADQHYIVMEHVGGGSLQDLLRKGGELPIGQLLAIGLELADALTRAHHLGIIHRDLKPDNVLLAGDGTPRLSDFGIAYLHEHERGRVTETGMVIGTLSYLSPEALDGEVVDARADIWSFGVLLFELLTGQQPFLGRNTSQIIAAIMTQPVPDLEHLRPEAPAALADLVYRMLEKDRQARMRSVRQVGLELENILQGQAKTQPPTRFETPLFSELGLVPRPKHNLSAQATHFFGRETELAALVKILADSSNRLVTIIAPGGMGKTRLALALAERYVGTPTQPYSTTPEQRFQDGVYFVELAPLAEPAAIVTAIAQATGYQFLANEREAQQQVLDFLAPKALLLVLDNYEHLLAGATLVTQILQAAPQVQIVVTSRQRLSQPGETLFHLSGMDFPAWETPEDALDYAAVKLFMHSAQRAQPGFALTADNLDYVARICRLVDGMPLGIVLAAAWLAMLSPEEIAAEITQSIDFLESSGGEVPARQRSIRGIFDQSWQMLTDAEQQVLMKLSVFRGGFTRDAAIAITGANLRVLMHLVNKALIRRDGETGRYEMHELLRQYSAEQLAASEAEYATSHAYSAYYCQWGHEQSQRLYGHGQKAAMARLWAAQANVAAAWLLAVQHEDTLSLTQGADLWFAYEIMGQYQTGYDLFQAALTRAPASERILRGKLLAGLCVFAYRLHLIEQSEQYSRQSIALLEGTAEHFARLVAQLNLGNTRWRLESLEAGEALYQATAAEAHTLGESWLEAACLGNLAMLAAVRADYTRAETLFTDTLQTRRASGDLWGQAFSLINLAAIYLYQERSDQARTLLHDALTVSRQIGLRLIEASALLELAYLDSLDGLLDSADAFLAQGRDLVSALSLPGFQDKLTAIEVRLLLRRGHDQAAQAVLLAYLQSTPQDYALILSLIAAAEILVSRGRYPRAVEVVAMVMPQLPRAGELAIAGKRLLQELAQQLSAETYAEAVARGEALTVEAVRQALLQELKPDSV